MKKYYIGLVIIAAIVVGLAIYTVSLGMTGKQDKKTEAKAQEIAEKLNTYISTNQEIPHNLDALGVKDVPKEITYTKNSEEEYEFCVTYKTADSGYGYDGFNLLTTALTARYGTGASYYDDTSSTSAYKPSSLYFYGGHKKGENCQTIKPYLYASNYSSSIYQGSTFPSASSSFTAPKDSERETDIKALHGQVEAYYAQNGYYPTLTNLNDSSWRNTNMKGLDDEALKDPSGSSKTLVGSPAANSYSYSAKSSSGGTCDNSVGKECAFYTLTATLSTGSTYSKYSLN